jgi:hypothetical protein
MSAIVDDSVGKQKGPGRSRGSGPGPSQVRSVAQGLVGHRVVAVELVAVGGVVEAGLELVLVLGVVVALLELLAVGFCTLSANISVDSLERSSRTRSALVGTPLASPLVRSRQTSSRSRAVRA